MKMTLRNYSLFCLVPAFVFGAGNEIKLTQRNPDNFAVSGYCEYTGPNVPVSPNNDRNTAVGANSLAVVTTGAANTAVGQGALSALQNGWSNVAVGYNTLAGATSGVANTAVGTYALGSLSTTTQNTAVGYHAGIYALGESNTLVGGYVMSEAGFTGSRNTAVGMSALRFLSSADNNTAIGENAGRNITTGDNNLLIGYGTGAEITTGSGNVIVGGFDGSFIGALNNNIIIADGVGNVRATYLTASGSWGFSNDLQVFGGDALAYRLTRNTVNSLWQSGVDKVYLGTTSDHPLHLIVNSSDIGVLSSSGLTVTGTLDVTGVVRFSSCGAGTAIFGSDGTICSFSGAGAKDILGDFTKGLSVIRRINPKLYHYKEWTGMPVTDLWAGVIAEDLVAAGLEEAVFSKRVVADTETKTNLVNERGDGVVTPVLRDLACRKTDPNGKLLTKDVAAMPTVSDRALIAALINAVKELADRNDALEARVAALETVISK